jgi:NADP-reducing hydrogenase subunit HndB
MQVTIGTEPKVTYGKVTPEVARRIMKEHVGEGKILKDHVIQA